MGNEVSLFAAEPSTTSAPAHAGLSVAWASLVKAVDLQPELAQRDCPSCHQPGYVGATRCGFCWVALTPLAVSHA